MAARNPFQQAPAARSPDDEANPYRSPAASLVPDAPPMAPGQLRPTRIGIGDVLTSTWEIYKSQMGMCIAVAITCIVLNIALQLTGEAIVGVAEAVGPVEVFIGANLVFFVVQWCIQLWLAAGQTLFMLRVGRGEEAPFTLLFSGGPYLIRIILATILMVLLSLAMAVVCALPALIGYFATRDQNLTLGLGALGVLLGIPLLLYVSLTFSQFQFLIIDRNMGPVESLLTSRQITPGNRLAIFALYIIATLLVFGGCFACLIGAVFTLPYSMLLFAVVYLAMTGQPTADQWLPQSPSRAPAPATQDHRSPLWG
ncbi:MAG: hypothetical protein WD278_01865 [Pirellulales bacterium]